MATRRTYFDGCAAAHALDIVGERWGLLVVRELLLGPKRFTDLRAGLPGAAPNVLSQRLRELEEVGVVRRATLAPPAASKVYLLTAWGRELEPVFIALGRWGSRSPLTREPAPMSVDSVLLALRVQFSPDRAGELAATVRLVLGAEEFLATVAAGALRVERAAGKPADAVLATDPDTFSAIAWGDRELTAAVADGAVVQSGDAAVAARFVELFPLPAPVTDERERPATGRGGALARVGGQRATGALW